MFIDTEEDICTQQHDISYSVLGKGYGCYVEMV